MTRWNRTSPQPPLSRLYHRNKTCGSPHTEYCCGTFQGTGVFSTFYRTWIHNYERTETDWRLHYTWHRLTRISVCRVCQLNSLPIRGKHVDEVKEVYKNQFTASNNQFITLMYHPERHFWPLVKIDYCQVVALAKDAWKGLKVSDLSSPLPAYLLQVFEYTREW